MSLHADTEAGTGRGRLSTRAGTAAALLGGLFLAATAYTYALSLTADFDPPHWARVAGLLWLPVGFVLTPVAYAVARTGPGRERGRLGVAAVVVGVLALTALLVALG